MINCLIDFSVGNRGVVFSLIAAASLAGWWSMRNLALDAIPDLSDTQVIIYSRWDRSPDLVEAQVTCPIVSAMLGAPGVKSVRGFSDFGYSYVYIIFEEGTDLYWARAHTQEYLAAVLPRLPQGVRTEMGPDATAIGWVFQYALVDESGSQSLADLRSYQDWYLRYYLKSVPGVAEVAPVGGFGEQFQVYDRQPFNAAAYAADCLAGVAGPVGNYVTGPAMPPLPEEMGWKDTVKSMPGETTRIIARFDVPPGTTLPTEYVHHCHILEHEENEMMRPFAVMP